MSWWAPLIAEITRQWNGDTQVVKLIVAVDTMTVEWGHISLTGISLRSEKCPRWDGHTSPHIIIGLKHTLRV